MIVENKTKTEYKQADTQRRDSAFYRFIKRAFDIAFSLCAIAALWLPMLVIAVLIKAEDGGTVLYAANRVGHNGKTFPMWKFRSMKSSADCLEDSLTKEQLEQYLLEFKIENDPRVTKIGRFLRKTSLDELPQFFNVLFGQMSVVGVRPIVEDELNYYAENRAEFLSVKPGITGYWQAYARNTVGYRDGKRQEMELHYVRHRSLRLDIKILFATVRRVVSGDGAI
ncbi:MAG TPA: sugar transferase [Ruminococcaceae bacterium]|nr:sugar transferase [Oscillospiraceae bacterium]